MNLPPPKQPRRRRITKRDGRSSLLRCERGNSVAHAATRAGHSRQLFYELRHADTAFAAGSSRWRSRLQRKVALEEVRDAEGNLVSTRRRQDPATVRFLLASHRPALLGEAPPRAPRDAPSSKSRSSRNNDAFRAEHVAAGARGTRARMNSERRAVRRARRGVRCVTTALRPRSGCRSGRNSSLECLKRMRSIRRSSTS
jgi:hypothetical protein